MRKIISLNIIVYGIAILLLIGSFIIPYSVKNNRGDENMKTFRTMKATTNGEFQEELNNLTEKELLVLIAFELFKTQQDIEGMEFTITNKEK